MSDEAMHFIAASIVFSLIVGIFTLMICFPHAADIFCACLAIAGLISVVFMFAWSITGG